MQAHDPLQPGQHAPAHSRSAFSLIELVVVIMIIAILSGLLLTGVQSAVNRARVAAVVADVKNVEQGIKEFQAKFSVSDPPPSRFTFFESQMAWMGSTPRNTALVRKLWPGFLDSSGLPKSGWTADINGNGIDMAGIELNGPECLVFFLGGVLDQDSDGNFFATGFSTDPTDPFKAGGTRIGPFLEMNPARLKSTGGEADYPEYMDAFPNSKSPYLYFSAYGGRGYKIFGDDNNRDTSGTVSGVNRDEVPFEISSPSDGFRSVYLQKAGTMMTAPIPWNAKTYQIISAGIRKEFGSGGTYDTEDGIPFSRKKLEEDNITNFSGGELK